MTTTTAPNEVLDDSLIVDTREGKQRTTAETPFSVSALKQFAEDPMKYYIRRCLKKREPQNVPLVFGSAIHDGFEAFYGAERSRVSAGIAAFDKTLEKGWEKVEDRTERYNPDEPHFAYDKQNFEVTLEELKERGRSMLVPFLGMLDHGWNDYTPTSLMKPVSQMQSELPEAGVERRLGDIAKDRGRPYTQMNLFDPQKGEFVKGMNVAIVGGLPIWGWVDLLMPWSDGSPTIIDHKGVTHVVSFYGPYRSFDPSYNPLSDLQLDVYGVATWIARSGFQFVTKQPQFVPDSGVLHDGWVDERAWLQQPDAQSKLPVAMTPGPQGNHNYITVWRPAPQDHPTNPQVFTPRQLLPRVYKKLRQIAEQITISNLLLESGVEPRIAFPSGNPNEIARKACPFCHYNEKGLCPTPRDTSELSERVFKETFKKRSEIIQSNSQIQERIQLWTAQHRSFLSS